MRLPIPPSTTSPLLPQPPEADRSLCLGAGHVRPLFFEEPAAAIFDVHASYKTSCSLRSRGGPASCRGSSVLRRSGEFSFDSPRPGSCSAFVAPCRVLVPHQAL